VRLRVSQDRQGDARQILAPLHGSVHRRRRGRRIRCDGASISENPRRIRSTRSLSSRTKIPCGTALTGRLGPADGVAIAFGSFLVLLRRRQLLADGVPVKLGTRAFDLLLVLLEAVIKEELLVARHLCLSRELEGSRKVLGEDRDFVRPEIGRGYRFTAALESAAPWNSLSPPNAARRGRTKDRCRGGSGDDPVRSAPIETPDCRSYPNPACAKRWLLRPRAPLACFSHTALAARHGMSCPQHRARVDYRNPF